MYLSMYCCYSLHYVDAVVRKVVQYNFLRENIQGALRGYKFFERKHVYTYCLLFLALGSNDCVCEEGFGSCGFCGPHMVVILLANVLTSRNSCGCPELF